MLLIFVNIAVVSAVLYCLAHSLKKTFSKEVDHFLSLFRSTRLPPGPRGVPILGSLVSFVGKNPYKAFSDLTEKYGDMVFVRLGMKNVLILRDPGMIKDAYRLVAFSDRPNTKLKDDKMIGNKGIIQSVGDVWSEHRRLILSAFRTLGLKTVTPQTSHIGEIIQRDVQEYLEFINRTVVGRPDGHAMLERLTGRLAGSSISSCVFGLKKSFQDEAFAQNVEIIEEGFQVGESIAPFEFLPVLRCVPGWWAKVEEKMKKNYCSTCKYFSGLITEKICEKTESEPDSLISIYREEMSKRNESKILSDEQLRQTMTDLFCAGTETVKFSLLWAMMYMTKHPEIQAAVQQEIDSVYQEEEQLAHYDDIGKMPLTEAVLLESLRLRPVLPMGHARSTHDYDTEYRGYEIPKGTVVLSLIWDIHQNPRYWEDPLEFRPSRFLTTEGKTFRPDNFIPFGTGRRLCLGDQLAMMSLFSTFASVLKQYTLVSQQEEVDMGWKIMLSLLVPTNFRVELVPRSQEQHAR